MSKLKTIKEAVLNELSKKTLASYVERSGKQNDVNWYQRGGGHKDQGNIKQIIKRDRGIKKALGKLTKEEKIDELSLGTLASYNMKANKQVNSKSANAPAKRLDKIRLSHKKIGQKLGK